MTGNQPDFLATKVQAPRRAPGLVERPRLTNFAGQLAAKRLTVIRAEAGFGKTSLALGWIDQVRKRGQIAAWLALDAEDSEPSRFLFYVAQSLKRACGAGEASLRLMSDTSLVRPNAIAASLVNELAEIDDDVFLVIDDYHLVSHDEVHATLAFIIRHAPSQFHLILTTRTEPPLPLATLRSQNLLLEIDATALRFDAQETRRLLHDQKIAVNDADARTIHDRTAGWPALLRIIASAGAKSGQSLARTLSDISGTARPLGAFLDEMLRARPRELVEFMVRISVLDRFSAALCEAVAGVMEAESLLEAVSECRLVTVLGDQDGRWFRYHPLLSEHLRRKLAREHGKECVELNRRAYSWYAAKELWTQAVQRAIAAGDTERAVAWIERCAMSLVQRGDLLTLMGWLQLFPAELMRGQSEIRLAIVWGMALALRLEEALDHLDEIEKDLAGVPADDVENLRSNCLAVRAVAVALKDDSAAGLTLAKECLRTTNDPWRANLASNVSVFGRLKAGDLKGVYATPWIPYSEEEVRRNLFAAIYRECLIGRAEFQQLHMSTAERHYVEGLRLAERHAGSNSICAALPAALLAQLRYEQGQVEEAETLVIDRVPLITAGGLLECALSATIVLARVAEWRGNIERAYSLLEQTEALASSRDWPRLAAAVLGERVRLLLSQGRRSAASAAADRMEALAAKHRAPNRCAWSEISVYTATARARLALAAERARNAVELLRAARAELEAAQDSFGRLEIEIVLATALIGANERSQANALYRSIVSVTGSAGIRQMLLDPDCASLSLLLGMQKLSPDDPGRRHSIAAQWRPQDLRPARIAGSPAGGDSLSARALGARVDRRGAIEQGNRADARNHPGDGQVAREEHIHEARG